MFNHFPAIQLDVIGMELIWMEVQRIPSLNTITRTTMRGALFLLIPTSPADTHGVPIYIVITSQRTTTGLRHKEDCSMWCRSFRQIHYLFMETLSTTT